MPETPNPTRTALIRSWQVAHAALERKDPEKTLAAALASAVELTNAERGFVVLRREGNYRATAELRTTHKEINDNEKLFSVAMVELALEKNQVLLVNDPVLQERFMKSESVKGLRIKTAILAPIIIKDETVGTLVLYDRKHVRYFTEEDKKLVESFVLHFALIVEALLERERDAAEKAARAEGTRRR
jgi:GAF domain-containing protein